MAFGCARYLRVIAPLGLAFALTACAAYERSRVNAKEDMLAAAGFVQRPADSPARQAAMAGLPPHRFLRRVGDGQVTWLYADPTICNCLYVGGQKSFATYQARRLQQRIADDRAQVAADMSYTNWDWGPWSVGYPTGFPYYLQ